MDQQFPKGVPEEVLRDDQSRQRVAEDLESTLFVEAGAGSGKTTALVSRIVALISTGKAPLRKIAAITFTEAAAAELRERLESRIVLACSDPAKSITERERLLGAAEDFQSSTISTLHGFAWKLLAEHPFEAGLPPGFKVIDQVSQSLAFESMYSRFINELLETPIHEALVLKAYAVGIDPASLRETAMLMDQSWDRIASWMKLSTTRAGQYQVENLNASDPKLSLSITPSEYESILGGIDAALSLRNECKSTDDRLAQHLDTLVLYRKGLVESEDDEVALLRFLTEEPTSIKSRYGRKENWTPGVLEEARAHLRVASEARLRLLERLSATILKQLLVLLGRLVLEEAHRRSEQGLLSFHDLLVRARDLLKNNEQVRLQLYGEYEYLLIDEFQDTDPLQLEIALLLAKATKLGSPRNGSLFFVGDPQQSIYRFRRADVTLFASARKDLGACGIELTRNFRSVPPIVEWVNGIFGELLRGPSLEPESNYRRLLASRSCHDSGAVWLVGGPVGASAGELRRLEADSIAKAATRALEERWPVADKDGNWRCASASDIAILVPTRSPLPYLAEALRSAGLEFKMEAGSTLWSSPELRDLLAVLQAIHSPGDEVALVAALRSSFLACSDRDLAKFRLDGGQWSPFVNPTKAVPPDSPVCSAMAMLRTWIERAASLGVSQIVSMVLEQAWAFEAAVARRSATESWERFRFFQEQARSAERNGGGLGELLQYATAQAAAGSGLADPIGDRVAQKGIRILTMHGAKGLEFPIVLLAGLGGFGLQGRSSRNRLLWSPQDSPEMRLRVGKETEGYCELEELDNTLTAQERLRVAYVACTRARDHLVVSCWHKSNSSSLASSLYQASDNHLTLWSRLEEEPIRLPKLGDLKAPDSAQPDDSQENSSQHSSQFMPETILNWDHDWQTSLRRAAKPRFVTATSLKAQDSSLNDFPTRSLPKASTAKENELGHGLAKAAWSGSRSASALGQAVHKVLELVDLSSGCGPDGETLEETAGFVCDSFSIKERQAQVIALANAALGAKVVMEASVAKHWKEIYLGVPFEDILLEGYVDLLFEMPPELPQSRNPKSTHPKFAQPESSNSGSGNSQSAARGIGRYSGNLCVVDYKTDSISGKSSLEEHAKRYRLQAAAYALGLETALGREVSRSVIVFLSSTNAVELEIEDLDRAKEEVLKEIGHNI